MASENARSNADKANRIKNNLNGQLRELQSLEAEIKRRDSKDLDELARAEHIAKAAAHLRTAISTLTPAAQGRPSRGLFGQGAATRGFTFKLPTSLCRPARPATHASDH